MAGWATLMSNFYLQLIPNDPTFVPPPQAQEHATSLFKGFFPPSCRTKAEHCKQIEFFHPGQNWEGVNCPLCGASLKDQWWRTAMDEAYKTNWTVLETTVPCCGSRCSLNDLTYNFTAGFARFVLEAENPGLAGIGRLDVDQINKLQDALGCSLRQIFC